MHPMLKLLASNRRKGQFRAETKTGSDEATVYLYDMIVDSATEAEWWGGIDPKTFITALNAIDAKTIHLRVNSPGGSVFAARAIEQAIREHSSEIIAHVDGYAASAASVLIMAADKIEMAPGAFLMIHKAWTLAYGNEEDMTKAAALLKQIDGSLVKTYVDRTAQSADDITAWMAAETWIDASLAVELGFADSIASDEQTKASAWDLSAYEKAPKARNTTPPQQKDAGPDRDALQRAAHLAIHVPA